MTKESEVRSQESGGNPRHNAAGGPSLPILRVAHLYKAFGEQRVLDGIDLTMEEGETLTVLGRSGTGKSVLLKLLIGLEKPDSGSIRIGEQEITGLSSRDLNEVRKKIGFLFQQAALYDSMTIEENVEFPLKRHAPMRASERKKRARGLLRRVGIAEHLDKLPAQLSGGMKKRVGLARALALDPQILMFDEPTAGLDPVTAAEIDELILDLKKERHITSVVVTHDIPSAKRISDRAVVLDQGKVIEQGTFRELEESRNPMVARFLGKER